MATTAQCTKAASFMAEEAGTIAAIAQQEILTGSPDYALKRIPETKLNMDSENPRYLRFRTTPPTRTSYQNFLPVGNTSSSQINPQTGAADTVSRDKQGRGCSLPAEKLQYGYDEHNSCLQGKAIEAGPWCIIDLLRKKAVIPLISKLRSDMPRYMKNDFGRQLKRDVITLSTHKFSVAAGFPMSTNVATFPCVPTGGPSIGFIRQIENILRPEGWDDGAMTPTINGRVCLQVEMSREAIEWAIFQRKKEYGLRLESTLTANDGTFGMTEIHEGIQFIEAKVPTRGYLRQTGASAYEVVELDPYVITDAGGEGFWPIPNPTFWNARTVFDNGAQYRVIEFGFIIHPKAMERQSMGAIPNVPGKTFTRAFDFSVESIPDYELADRGCNKDMFYFGYRALHADAPLPKNPELMTAFAFLAPQIRITITDPWTDSSTAAVEPISLAGLTAPAPNACEPCTVDNATAVTRDVNSPTCTDLFPTNGAGTIRMRQIAYSVDESAGNLTIVVDRDGGSTGSATVVITINEGTATEPENFSIPSGFAGTTGVSTAFTKTITWADTVSGPKTVVIPIVVATGDDNLKVFTAVLSSATTASLGSATTSTITILDPDEAA